jgi:DNA-binding NarL/FixJ family response regulator
MPREALATEDRTPVLAPGAEAFDKMREASPDVIVIHLDMRDGYTLLARVESAMWDFTSPGSAVAGGGAP